MNIGTRTKLCVTSPREVLSLVRAILLPARHDGQHRVYVNTKPGPDQAPHIFAGKLSAELERRGVMVSFSGLPGCTAALMLISTPGDNFFRMAGRLRVRTVLRIDGFFLPSYFDNRPQPPLFQDRRLTPERIAVNQRIQRDLQLADHIVYQSRFSKEMCDLYLYNRQEHFSIIHNGVDVIRFTPVDVPPRPITLLSAGNLRHEYLLGTVFPVFWALKEIFGLRLLIVGTMDGINRQIFDDYRKRDPANFDRTVTYGGPVSNYDMPGWFAKADILVHPRAGDWSPNVVAEALACSLPVVCPKWGGAAEMIGDGGVAVEAEAWDYSERFIDAMIDGTRQVIERLDEYKKLARERAINYLTLDRMTGVYCEALGIPRGSSDR